MNCKQKKNGGITLIALVITILILVILAGVTIATLKNTNLFNNAIKAKEKSDYEAAKEAMNIKLSAIEADYEMHGNGEAKLQFTADKLCEDDDIEYVNTEGKKEASIAKITLGQNVTKIYTKLKKYKDYEFGINSNIEIASINGKVVGSGESEEIKIKLTNKFDKYIYIDANNGNDTTGDGSKLKPYKTLEKISTSGIIENNYTYGIILEEGTYYFTYPITTLNCNKSINIIGKCKKTTLSVSRLGSPRFLGDDGSSRYSINFYRLIWDGNNSYETNTIAIVNPINIYNVLFIRIAGAIYGCINPLVNMVNSTVNNDANIVVRNYYNPKITNCYGDFRNGYNANQNDWDYKTNRILSNTSYTLDSDYQIKEAEENWKDVGTGTDLDESKADLGIYGGEYSWKYNSDID